MLKLKSGKTVTEEEKGISNTYCIDTLKIVEKRVNFVHNFVQVTWMKGSTNKDGSFTMRDGTPITLEFRDEAIRTAHKSKKDKDGNETGEMEPFELPRKTLFTDLTTPKKDQKDRWRGDFRLADIEQMVMESNLLSDYSVEIEAIIPEA